MSLIDEANLIATYIAGDAEPEDLVATLDEIRNVQKILAVVKDDIVAAVCKDRAAGALVGTAEVSWRKKGEKFDKAAAARSILAREYELATASPDHAVDPETGEVVPTWQQAMDAVNRHWNLPNPRKTSMKTIDIDPKLFASDGEWQADLIFQD